jgi:hypothetical protein
VADSLGGAKQLPSLPQANAHNSQSESTYGGVLQAIQLLHAAHCAASAIFKHPRHALTFHFQAASWLLKKSTLSSSGALKHEKSAR